MNGLLIELDYLATTGGVGARRAADMARFLDGLRGDPAQCSVEDWVKAHALATALDKVA